MSQHPSAVLGRSTRPRRTAALAVVAAVTTSTVTFGPGARHLPSLDAGIVAVPDEPTPEPTVTPSAVPETPAAPSEQPSEQPVVPASGGGDHGGPDQVEVHSGEGAGLVGTSGWTPLALGGGSPEGAAVGRGLRRPWILRCWAP